MFNLDLEKAEEPEIKLPTFVGSKKKQENSRKKLFLLHWLRKAFGYGNHNKLWKILKEIGIPDHLTCLLRNLYAGQKATVRNRHGTMAASAAAAAKSLQMCPTLPFQRQQPTSLPRPWDSPGKSTGVGCHCLLEQWTASKLGKEYIQTIYCYLVYLTYMQNTLCECRTGWSTSWNQDCWEKYQ